jgi:hypothetical protein
MSDRTEINPPILARNLHGGLRGKESVQLIRNIYRKYTIIVKT